MITEDYFTMIKLLIVFYFLPPGQILIMLTKSSKDVDKKSSTKYQILIKQCVVVQ